MAQTNRIKCKHCEMTHTLSEGCGGGIARKLERFQVKPTSATPVSPPVTPPVTEPVTQRVDSVTKRVENNVTPVTKPRGRPKLHANEAERARAYRQRKKEQQP